MKAQLGRINPYEFGQIIAAKRAAHQGMGVVHHENESPLAKKKGAARREIERRRIEREFFDDLEE